MRLCDLDTAAGRIRYAMEHLETVWNETAKEWDDEVSRRFRAHHLDPAIPRVKLGLDAISRMNLLMTEVERDCES